MMESFVSPGGKMPQSVQDEIGDQLREQGYRLVEVEDDQLFFSLDENDNPGDRHKLAWLDETATSPDYMILSTRHPGKLGDAWKVGRMLRVTLTDAAMHPQAARSFPVPGGLLKTHELDRHAVLDRLSAHPTAEQKLGMDLLAIETLAQLDSQKHCAQIVPTVRLCDSLSFSGMT